MNRDLRVYRFDNTITELKLPDFNDIEDCVELYQNTIKLRSIITEELIKTIFEDSSLISSIGDTNVKQFLLAIGLDGIETNKTPDILLFDDVNNILYLGDVAVTNNVNVVSEIKSTKYDQIREDIYTRNIKRKLKVVEYSFIISDKLNNLMNELEGMKIQFDLTITDYIVQKYTNNMRIISTFLDLVRRNVKNRRLFFELLESNRSSDLKELHNYGKRDKINEIEPIKREEELFYMIMEEIDRIDSEKRIEETKDMVYAKEEVINSIKEKQIELKSKERQQVNPFIICPSFELLEIDEDLIEKHNPLELLRSYKIDLSFNFKGESSKLIELLPNDKEMDTMLSLREFKLEFKRNIDSREKIEEIREISKFMSNEKVKNEFFCYKGGLTKIGNTQFYKNLEDKCYTKHKKEDNIPKTIPIEKMEDCKEGIEMMIKFLSKENLGFKFDRTKDLIEKKMKKHQRVREIENVKQFDEIIKIKRSNNGLYLSNIRQFANDINYINNFGSKGLYYSIPVEFNVINLVFTNSDFTKNNNGQVKYLSLFRLKKLLGNDIYNKQKLELYLELYRNRIELVEETQDYYYILIKPHSIFLQNLSKLIDCDYELNITLDCMNVLVNMDKTINFGEKSKIIDYLKRSYSIYTILATDLHQCPSELLDLMKYVTGINMSTVSNTIELFKDKMLHLYKSNLDLWLLSNILDYFVGNIKIMKKFNNLSKLQNVLKLGFSEINDNFEAKSFIDRNFIITSIEHYFSEAQILFQVRPKKLYNSQFIDKAMESVVKFNDERLENVIDEYKNKNVISENNYKRYNFKKDRLFDKDAVIYATEMQNRDMIPYLNKIYGRSYKRYESISSNNCSMRGSCLRPELMGMFNEEEELFEKERIYLKMKSEDKTITKSEIKRLNELEKINKEKEKTRLKRKGIFNKEKKLKFSTTALLNNILQFETLIKNDETDKMRVYNLSLANLEKKQYYNMSEKEQRGSGRPIGAPDPITKQKLLCIEIPFESAGEFQEQNLLAKRVNRAAKLSSMSKNFKEECLEEGFDFISYLVQDQSKFSEGDNLDKFITYITNSSIVLPNVKLTLIEILNDMKTRYQHFPNINSKINKDHSRWITSDGRYVIGSTGWVQGMLNRISTSFHIAAADYIIELYNKFSNDDDKIKGINLVNSDDSLTIVGSKSIKSAKKFYKFMELGKKMFCLNQNKKKSYMSFSIGEIIQLYIYNDSVVNIWSKPVIASYKNILGLDPHKDVLSIIGQLTTLHRLGVPENLLSQLKYSLKLKYYRLYNIGDGKINSLRNENIDYDELPCEIGGWPGLCSTFELCIAGTYAQLFNIMDRYKSIKKREIENIENIPKNIKILISSILSNLINQDSELLDLIRIENNGNINIEKINKFIMKNEEKYGKYKGLINSMIDFKERYIEKEKIKIISENEDKIDWSEDKNGLENEIYANAMINENQFSVSRNLISSIKSIIPLNKQLSKTVEKLRSFNYESSGCEGLFANRTSIQVSIADKREMSNSEALTLSEQNMISNPRKRAKLNAVMSTGRRYIIKPFNMPMKFSECILFLVRMYDSLAYSKNTDLINVERTIFDLVSDPSSKADIASFVMQNTKIEGKREKTKILVNTIPDNITTLDIKNDLAAIMCELVKPGYLSTQGYKFKYPNRVDSDMLVIKNTYNLWDLGREKSNKNLLVMIYFHYLSIRRSKYFIGASMKVNNNIVFCLDVFLKARFNDKIEVGSILELMKMKENKFTTKKDTQSLNQIKNIVDNITGAYETVKYMLMNSEIHIRDLITDIYLENVSKNKKFIELKNLNFKSEVTFLFGISNDHIRKMLSSYMFLVHNDRELLDEYIKIKDMKTKYIVENKRIKVGNTVQYSGYFEAAVTRGKNVIIIKGHPGNIKVVQGNTFSSYDVGKMLDFFFNRETFYGYNKGNISSKNSWATLQVARSKNMDSSLRIEALIGGGVDITSNKNKKYETTEKRLKKLQSELQKIINLNALEYTKNNSIGFMPYEYNTNISKYVLTQTQTVDNYEFDRGNMTIRGSYKFVNPRGDLITRYISDVKLVNRNYSSIFDNIRSEIMLENQSISNLSKSKFLSSIIRRRNELKGDEDYTLLLKGNSTITNSISNSIFDAISMIYNKELEDEEALETIDIKISTENSETFGDLLNRMINETNKEDIESVESYGDDEIDNVSKTRNEDNKWIKIIKNKEEREKSDINKLIYESVTRLNKEVIIFPFLELILINPLFKRMIKCIFLYNKLLKNEGFDYYNKKWTKVEISDLEYNIKQNFINKGLLKLIRNPLINEKYSINFNTFLISFISSGIGNREKLKNNELLNEIIYQLDARILKKSNIISSDSRLRNKMDVMITKFIKDKKNKKMYGNLLSLNQEFKEIYEYELNGLQDDDKIEKSDDIDLIVSNMCKLKNVIRKKDDEETILSKLFESEGFDEDTISSSSTRTSDSDIASENLNKKMERYFSKMIDDENTSDSNLSKLDVEYKNLEDKMEDDKKSNLSDLSDSLNGRKSSSIKIDFEEDTDDEYEIESNNDDNMSFLDKKI